MLQPDRQLSPQLLMPCDVAFVSLQLLMPAHNCQVSFFSRLRPFHATEGPTLSKMCVSKCIKSCGCFWAKIEGNLKLPTFVNRLDCPFELLPQCLGEELLNRHVEFLRENHRQTWVDVILQHVSKCAAWENDIPLTIFEVPRATSLLLSLSSACTSIVAMR